MQVTDDVYLRVSLSSLCADHGTNGTWRIIETIPAVDSINRVEERVVKSGSALESIAENPTDWVINPSVFRFQKEPYTVPVTFTASNIQYQISKTVNITVESSGL